MRAAFRARRGAPLTQRRRSQGGANDTRLSDPQDDTADFADGAPGNIRADYVLPRKNLRIVDAGVFWPLRTDPAFAPVDTLPFASSDHRLDWIDLAHGAF